MEKESKKMQNDKVGKTKKIVSFILIIIFAGIMIYSAMEIYLWWQDNQKSQSILEDISDTVTIDEEKDEESAEKYIVDFENLKQKNSDTVAWIKVEGTNIEYPVVQASQNEYYLTHSFDKSYNSAGWIFMDSSIKLDGTDKNIVIFGHNRKDKSMFGSLRNVLSAEWYNNENNRYIPFITENESAMYEVFSVYTVDVEDYYITTKFSNMEQFASFIKKIKSRSVKDFGVEVTTEDSILTLSTCAGSDRRTVLHAKKILNTMPDLEN